LTLPNMLNELKGKAPQIHEWVRRVVPQTSYRNHRRELRDQMIEARLAEACIHIMGLARVHSTHTGSKWALVETLILMAHKAPQALHEYSRRKHVAIDKKSAEKFLDHKERGRGREEEGKDEEERGRGREEEGEDEEERGRGREEEGKDEEERGETERRRARTRRRQRPCLMTWDGSRGRQWQSHRLSTTHTADVLV
jgi:hypothetical protein